MIIDFHTHIRLDTILTDRYWKGWIGIAHESSGVPKEKIRNKIEGIIVHADADELIQAMDEAGVDKAVVIVVDFGWCKDIGYSSLTWEEVHQPVVDAVRKYPDRLIMEIGIDPRRPNAVELVERGMKEWGAKGLKLHPCVGVYPNDPICYPVWEKAQELGIVIHIHTGTEPWPFRIKYCQPIFVDDVAVDFPDATIVMAHCGMWDWQQTMTVVGQKPNVLVDLAVWQQWAHTNPVEFFRCLRTMFDWVGYRRFMIGSDWPAVSLLMSEERWFDIFRSIPEEVTAAGIEFKKHEIDGVLGDNAARILQLT